MVLALGAAVACVVFTASILGGFSHQIERMAFGAYPRTLVVRANPLVPSRSGPPSLDDRAWLHRELPGVEASAAWVEGMASVRSRHETRNVPVFGAVGDYRRELDADLEMGRWMSDGEAAGLGRVCILGPILADFLGREEIVGREVSLSGSRCEVIGVLDYARSRPAGRFNDAAIAPFLSTRRYFTVEEEAGPRDASWLSFFMPPGADMEDVRYRADRLLRKAAGVPLSRESPYRYDDPEAAVRDQVQQRDILARLLWTVTAAALATSLTGYAGIAFAATTARKREVALRLAMGGTPGGILKQLTLEHAMIGVMGSASGLLLGLAGAWAASLAWGWPVRLSASAAAASVTLGCLIGLFVGLEAARRAARTSPALAAKG
jgi:putative ABC transport system permease protein